MDTRDCPDCEKCEELQSDLRKKVGGWREEADNGDERWSWAVYRDCADEIEKLIGGE